MNRITRIVLVVGLLVSTIVLAQQSTNLPPMPQDASSQKKPRTFVKTCPDCGTVCVSTNLVWNGGSLTERWGTVRFTCNNTNCESAGEMFWEEIKQPIKRSAPMVEIK